MVDSTIVAHWKDTQIELVLPDTFSKFKLNCKKAFNFTDKQMEELKLQYKDPDDDAEDAFIIFEEEADYQGLLDSITDDTFILINTIEDNQVFESTANPNGKPNEQVEELKRSIIQSKEESLLQINELKNESKQSIREMKTDLIKEIKAMLSSQQNDIISQLNNKIIGLEEKQQSMQEELQTKLEEQQKQFNEKIEQSSMMKMSVEPQKHLITHEDIECNECSEYSFTGVRYKCHTCSNYNLCQNCFDSIDHEHLLYAIKDSNKMPKECKKVIKKVKVNNPGNDLRNTTKPKVNNDILSPMKEKGTVKPSPQPIMKGNSFQSNGPILNNSFGLNNSGSGNAMNKNDSFKQGSNNNNKTFNANANMNMNVDEDNDSNSDDDNEDNKNNNNSGVNDNNNNSFQNKERGNLKKSVEDVKKEEVVLTEEEKTQYQKIIHQLDKEYNLLTMTLQEDLMSFVVKHKGNIDEIKKELELS